MNGRPRNLMGPLRFGWPALGGVPAFVIPANSARGQGSVHNTSGRLLNYNGRTQREPVPGKPIGRSTLVQQQLGRRIWGRHECPRFEGSCIEGSSIVAEGRVGWQRLTLKCRWGKVENRSIVPDPLPATAMDCWPLDLEKCACAHAFAIQVLVFQALVLEYCLAHTRGKAQVERDRT